jgi:hypothetical protein
MMLKPAPIMIPLMMRMSAVLMAAALLTLDHVAIGKSRRGAPLRSGGSRVHQ